MVEVSSLAPQPTLRREIILIVDDSERFVSLCRRWLREKGFYNLRIAGDVDSALDAVETLNPDLVLLDIHLNDCYDGLEILQSIRTMGYRGIVVVISGDSSKEQCFRAAKAGANDFLLKRPLVSIADEVERMLSNAGHGHPSLASASLSDLGYLRSFGLTKREIEILENFAVDFSPQKIVAKRVNAAPVQLRKSFARIYKKLGVENSSQLVHLLTVCSMFHQL